MAVVLPQNLIKLSFMLSLELIIVIIPHTEDVFCFWFTNIYTFVSVLLLVSSCVKNSSVY